MDEDAAAGEVLGVGVHRAVSDDHAVREGEGAVVGAAGSEVHLSRSSFLTSRRLFCRLELNVSIASMISFIFCFLARFRS